MEELSIPGRSREDLGKGVLILGDSELVIGFCVRRYKPSKRFFHDIASARTLARRLPVPVTFRHVYREHNQLPDWLANVAKQLTHLADLTLHLL
jgi:hypothetical protein